jgi:hypothetical protein
MSKRIQLYDCKFVPSLIPEFVDSHITVDMDLHGNESYIIEVDPTHPVIQQAQRKGLSIDDLLKKFGVQEPQLFYSGDRPKH